MSGHGNEVAGGCPFSAPVQREGAAAKRVAGLRVSRRGFITGLLGLASFQAIGGLGASIANAVKPKALKGAHGGDLRGLDVAVKVGRDREARFGLMFKKLPAYAPSDALLNSLATSMNDHKAPLNDVANSDVAFDTSTPSGFVYLGQFIDHDMTLDSTPLSDQQQDVRGTTNFESPAFDLSSVYGKGPAQSPELYDPAKPGYMLLNPHDDLVDVPRDDLGAAFLGDPRNDENLIIAQMQTVFLRLHNVFRDQGKTFEQAQKLTRWHYQWVIVHDFLPRMVGQDVVDSLLTTTPAGIVFTGKLYQPKNLKKPYMPVEYSGAAYRFGHSMIRAEYEMQDGHTVPIFGADGYEDLRGNRPIPHNLWVDWNYFFDIPGLNSPDDRNMARLVDTQISLPLFTLPSTVVAPTAGAIVALAQRNLLRGKRLGLPAGQDVATSVGVTPLTNAQLGLTDAGWKGKAPLWFYLLKESELLGGKKLGPVAGRIVAEVILGLLALDKTSYFKNSNWSPAGSSFRMGDLILLANALDPRSRIVPVPEPVPAPAPVTPAPVDGNEVINPGATTPLPGPV